MVEVKRFKGAIDSERRTRRFEEEELSDLPSKRAATTLHGG
jgi:hypothetical protein